MTHVNTRTQCHAYSLRHPIVLELMAVTIMHVAIVVCDGSSFLCCMAISALRLVSGAVYLHVYVVESTELFR